MYKNFLMVPKSGGDRYYPGSTGEETDGVILAYTE